MGGFLATKEGAQAIERLMMTLAFPDIYPPTTLGFSQSALTIPHHLFYKFSVPWSAATTTPANTMPNNEVWAVVLSKHPCCALIFNYAVLNGTVLIKTLLMGGQVPSSTAGYFAFNTALRSFADPVGTIYEPVFNEVDTDEGNFVWIDGGSNVSHSIAIVAASAAFTATLYTLYMARRFGSRTGYVQLTFTPGAPTANLTFTAAAGTIQPGYYALRVNGANVAATTLLSITIQANLGGGQPQYFVAHAPAPAGICTTMDAIRINAARGTMTNFSGPFNAEGGAAAYEMPIADRWDEYVEDTASGTYGLSVFTNVVNSDGAMVFENADGISLPVHPDLQKEPVDCTDASSIGSNTVTANLAVPSFDDISGGTMLVIRTAPGNTAARDGLWQISYHSESQNSSQLYTKYPPAYSPLVVLEADGLFKSMRTISHNPNHFRAGVSALRSIMSRGGNVGDALISTGVAAPLGGTIKGASGIGKKLLKATGF